MDESGPTKISVQGPVDKLETQPKRVVVEIGVGENPSIHENSPAGKLPQTGDKYYAVELERHKTYTVKKGIESSKGDYQAIVIRADAGSLPFPDGSVDELAFTNILNADRVEGRTQDFMNEALRVIKIDGKILIIESVGNINEEYEPFLQTLQKNESLKVSKHPLPNKPWRYFYEITKI